MTNPTPTAAAPTQPETELRARIQPLGENLIIRTIPVSSISSILLPDSAKGITMMGEKGPMDAVHCVEAEVVAVGPGKRQKADDTLTLDQNRALSKLFFDRQTTEVNFNDLFTRANKMWKTRLKPIVKPGDRILYHPAVQKFDRDITDVMQHGEELNGSKYFMIREESVLAVIER